MTKVNDEAAINAAAASQFEAIYPLLADYSGRATWALANLNFEAAPRRLKRFRLLDRHLGRWTDLDGNASGPDVISLVEFLGQTSRERAIEFLGNLLPAKGRLVKHDIAHWPTRLTHLPSISPRRRKKGTLRLVSFLNRSKAMRRSAQP